MMKTKNKTTWFIQQHWLKWQQIVYMAILQNTRKSAHYFVSIM